ncbi:hypothetical protein BH24ACI4_BH24ACI4_20490 [soil metagenome]
MWWRVLITVLLAAIVGLLLWDRERVMSVLPGGASPHEAYVRSLEAAGLEDTALGRDWLAAARRALVEPEKTSLPMETTLRHAAAQPRAFGYLLDLRRGRVLNVNLTLEAEEPAHVFIDLFEVRTGEAPSAVASARRDSLTLEHEIRRDGQYIVRIQPELLRGGDLRIGNRTTAALTFPVAGQDVSAVRSFFLDPRDAGRRQHHGVDIFAPRETPVLAASDGIVVSAGTNRLGGNVVWVLDPARRQRQYYAHLSRQAVSGGERVSAGDVLGYVGNTGNARGTPPHLHFGIYALQEGPIDPLPFVSGARGPQPPSTSSSPPSSPSGSTGEKPPQRSTGVGG